jgi:hypothetical protein
MMVPIPIVVPGRRPEDDLHGRISSCSSPLPASSPRTASSRRSALRGELSRCMVSSIEAHSDSEISTAPSPRWRAIAIGARPETTLSSTLFQVFAGKGVRDSLLGAHLDNLLSNIKVGLCLTEPHPRPALQRSHTNSPPTRRLARRTDILAARSPALRPAAAVG